jgi:beta-lactam-binding protein with PASTA domain
MFLFIIGIFTFLRTYTHYGQSIAVPSFHGLTLKESKTLAAQKKLNIELEDSVYKSEAKPSTIVNQSPPPNFKVKKNRNIFLTINASHPPKIEVPSVVGVSLRQAKAILETKGFEVGKISYAPDMARNIVLAQKYKEKKISPGKKIYKGSKIELILGNGYRTKKVTTPNLQGLKKYQAKDKLILSNLNIGKIYYDRSIKSYKDSVDAIVYKQSPAYYKNSRIYAGSKVNLYLTTDTTKIK